MTIKTSVFIATSIDGYIADRYGKIDWLQTVQNPEHNDMGYSTFIQSVDAILMGRKTFETVLGFDLDWPYNIPVYVLSNTLNEVPETLHQKAFLVKGDLEDILNTMQKMGYKKLYIDGGTTISCFLKADLVDEMTITILPIVLGGGSPLFHNLPKELNFELLKTQVYLKQITQNHYRRIH